MKKYKKLSLDKIKIARLHNPQLISGGAGNDEFPTGSAPEHCETHPFFCWESISTKTVPISGQTCVCL
ncbi:hypothetical protein GCM10009430_17800 [Aquimarina litoralis]|uniref:Natural product n=1 Tax=Aquimarina litoralis TaxID=584605 RepID=A0ABN1IQ32_9FLAO